MAHLKLFIGRVGKLLAMRWCAGFIYYIEGRNFEYRHIDHSRHKYRTDRYVPVYYFIVTSYWIGTYRSHVNFY